MKAYLFSHFTSPTLCEIIARYDKTLVIKSLSEGTAYHKGETYYISNLAEFYKNFKGDTLTGRITDFESVPIIKAPPQIIKDWPYTGI